MWVHGAALFVEAIREKIAKKRRERGNQLWPVAHASIVDSSTEKLAARAFTCTAVYQYRVADRFYSGKIVETFVTEKDATTFVSTYHVDRTLTVRYKPDQPGINVIRDEDNFAVNRMYA